jgi:hypothetical protein
LPRRRLWGVYRRKLPKEKGKNTFVSILLQKVGCFNNFLSFFKTKAQSTALT